MSSAFPSIARDASGTYRECMLTTTQLDQFSAAGYTVVPALLDAAEVDEIRDEFMEIGRGGPIAGHFAPTYDNPDDPLATLPRVMQPHRFNDVARKYLLDKRFRVILEQLFGEEPLAAQSMFYYKPPGARGQALHQDNFYLRVEPGTCIAAWVAIDVIGRDNGGLEVVPGTHAMDIFCPDEADPDVSFTRDYVPPPPGLAPVPVDMSPGDVLFFNGSLVHGSGPNTTTDRFRRSFIAHYLGRSSEKISTWYHVLTMDGDDVDIAPATGGGPCGVEVAAGPH